MKPLFCRHCGRPLVERTAISSFDEHTQEPTSYTWLECSRRFLGLFRSPCEQWHLFTRIGVPPIPDTWAQVLPHSIAWRA